MALQRFRVTMMLLGSRDVIDHVTIEHEICGFLLVVKLNQPSISHGFEDIKLEKTLVRDFDLLVTRDVIGYKTIGLAMNGFL